MEDVFYSAFRDLVENLSTKKKNEVFFVGNKSSLEYVNNAIFDTAKEYIYILCANVNDLPYKTRFHNFLTQEKSVIKILFDDFKDRDYSYIEKLSFKYGKQIEFRKLRDKSRIIHDGNHTHIIVSDDRMFRITVDTIEYKAWGNFNRPEQAKPLKLGFEKYFTDEYSNIIDVKSACTNIKGIRLSDVELSDAPSEWYKIDIVKELEPNSDGEFILQKLKGHSICVWTKKNNNIWVI